MRAQTNAGSASSTSRPAWSRAKTRTRPSSRHSKEIACVAAAPVCAARVSVQPVMCADIARLSGDILSRPQEHIQNWNVFLAHPDPLGRRIRILRCPALPL